MQGQVDKFIFQVLAFEAAEYARNLSSIASTNEDRPWKAASITDSFAPNITCGSLPTLLRAIRDSTPMVARYDFDLTRFSNLSRSTFLDPPLSHVVSYRQ